MGRIEEDYEDVLQNIELGIVMTYREFPKLADFDVIRALETLIDRYKAEIFDKTPRPARLSELQQELLETAATMCEHRLGRLPLEDADTGELVSPATPITVDEILLSLKRLLKSVQFWRKKGGKQGYLEYVNRYFP